MIATSTPTLKKLFVKPFLVLEYDAEHKLLIQNWKGFASSAQFREGIEKSIEAFKQYPINSLLSDAKEFSLVKKEDTDWAASYAANEMIKRGLKRMAFIIPTNAFSHMSVKNFSSQAGNGFMQQYFDDKTKAFIWLDE